MLPKLTYGLRDQASSSVASPGTKASKSFAPSASGGTREEADSLEDTVRPGSGVYPTLTGLPKTCG